MSLATSFEVPPLRRLPVPQAAPRPALRLIGPESRAVAPTQGTLALSAVEPAAANPPVGWDGEDDDFARPRRTPAQALPEPRRWAAQFVRAAVEVTAGIRPPSQLVRWTSEEVQATLARRATLAVRAARAAGRAPVTTPRPVPCRVVVRSARACIPRDGVAEVSLVVSDGSRLRAVAVRLDGLDGRWRATALEIG